MKKVRAFQANDGTVFTSELDCLAHEQKSIKDLLIEHVTEFCEAPEVEDWNNAAVITKETMAEYILNNWFFLLKLLAPLGKKEIKKEEKT
jgi:hypothetical protein